MSKSESVTESWKRRTIELQRKLSAVQTDLADATAENAELRRKVEAAESYRHRVRDLISNPSWYRYPGGIDALARFEINRETWNALMETDPFRSHSQDEQESSP